MSEPIWTVNDPPFVDCEASRMDDYLLAGTTNHGSKRHWVGVQVDNIHGEPVARVKVSLMAGKPTLFVLLPCRDPLAMEHGGERVARAIDLLTGEDLR